MQDQEMNSEMASTFSPGNNSSSSKNRVRKSPEQKQMKTAKKIIHKATVKQPEKVYSITFNKFNNVEII